MEERDNAPCRESDDRASLRGVKAIIVVRPVWRIVAFGLQPEVLGKVGGDTRIGPEWNDGILDVANVAAEGFEVGVPAKEIYP